MVRPLSWHEFWTVIRARAECQTCLAGPIGVDAADLLSFFAGRAHGYRTLGKSRPKLRETREHHEHEDDVALGKIVYISGLRYKDRMGDRHSRMPLYPRSRIHRTGRSNGNCIIDTLYLKS
jgi:hypothetical protein